MERHFLLVLGTGSDHTFTYQLEYKFHTSDVEPTMCNLYTKLDLKFTQTCCRSARILENKM